MRKSIVIISIIIIAVLAVLKMADYSITARGDFEVLNVVMENSFISSSKLWFVTEKGELYTRESKWDESTLSETGVIVRRAIDEGFGIYALSTSNQYSGPIYVIKNDGTLWELIEDDNQYTLAKVNGIENCVKVIAGAEHIVALTSDGAVYTWGDNKYGQLGDDSAISRKLPKRIKKLSKIIDVSAGSNHCMALDNNGKVYTWGDNIVGQIGDGSFAGTEEERKRSSVHPVEGLSDIAQISTGDSWCAVLSKNGDVFHWGSRGGVQNSDCLPSPDRVASLTDIVQISAFGGHSLALSSSGELWSWGSIRFVFDGGWDPPRRIAEFPDDSIILAGLRDTVITSNNGIWQGNIAIIDGAGSAPYWSGKFVQVFTEEDVQNYEIRIGN